MGLGTGEIILIFLVVMVVFGASKLPSANEIEVAPKKPEIDGSAPAEKAESAKPGDKAS